MGVRALVPTFVGRASELAEVGRLLSSSRLVTIVGVGGAGKTRLAYEAAARLEPRFAGRVFRCELAAVAGAQLVEPALASALGFPPEVARGLGDLARERFGDEPALIVLDNCEHVREAAARVATALLESTGGLRVLTTSRERLRVPGEMVWSVPSMAADDALELIKLRTAERDAAFSITAENRPDLAEICRRLEGLPLALELVAPRLALLPAAEVADLLDDALAVLAGGDGAARHRTMRAALNWSVDLLPEQGRSDLWQLGVFPTAFSLEAAATVLSASTGAVIDRLTVLQEASLLVADRSGPRARFRLLEPVRQYAAERLSGTEDEADVRRRHARHVLGAAEWIGERLLGTPEQAAALVAFEGLLPDLRQAVAWALEAEPAWAARIMGHTGWAWEITARLREGEALLRLCRDGATEPADRARLLIRLLSVALRRTPGDDDLFEIRDAAIAEARRAANTRELGYALTLGIVGKTRESASSQLDEAQAVAMANGDTLIMAWEQFMRSYMLASFDDYRAARPHIERALELLDLAGGDAWLETQTSSNIVNNCLELGDNQGARKYMRRVLARLELHPEWIANHQALEYSAFIAARGGRPGDALRLVGATRRLRAELGALQFDLAEVDQPARAELGSRAESERCLAEGARLTLGEALALATKVVEEPSRRPESGLSRRELEVATLVAGGLTNKEIAERLHRSVRTVEGHVDKVLAKLDVRSRVQVATWAAEHGLLDGRP